MKQTNSRTVRDALKSINETYGFMLARGYEFLSADDYDQGWQAVLRKQDVFAKIIRSRGEEELYFRSSTQPPDEFTDIGSVIYAATGNRVPRSESSDPKVIEQNLDKIESYFTNEYLKNKDGLRTAREEYSAASYQEYYAALPQRKAVVPPEPTRKPILYYPLLAIIILLILGGLITLGMVLIDRFVSPF